MSKYTYADDDAADDKEEKCFAIFYFSCEFFSFSELKLTTFSSLSPYKL